MIREPVLRGVREVAGMVFAPEAADRVLTAWVEGSELLRLDDSRLVLRFPEPQRMRGEDAPGAPLVLVGGRLVGLPLAEVVPPGDVVLLEGGRLVGHRLVGPVDPASLLDLSGWHVERAVEVDAAPPSVRPATPTLALPPVDFDPRQRLGGQPEPTRRDRAEQRRLQRRRQERAASGPRRPRMFDPLFARRQQRYLDDLTRRFAAGQLDEALRRAIPLGGRDGPLAHSPPGVRPDLRIHPEREGGTSTVPVDAGLRAELEQRYRQAFVTLEAEGRILDAAFVLAELLDRSAEAVSFLERHGELRLAAELAEARELNPTEAVRLWWRAGDRDRAVALARRHGCFAGAVVRLERSGRQAEAASLRRTWMGHLLQAGDLVGAYDAGGPLEGEEVVALRRRVVELGIAGGGPLRARMLARQLRSGGDAPHPELEVVLADPSAERDRALVASELTSSRQRVDHPGAVRRLVRSVLADGHGVGRSVVDGLLALAEDPVLRADLPPAARPPPVDDDDREPLWVEVDGSDRGLVGVSDARLLPDGAVALAVDGLGVRLVRGNGRTAVELDLLASHLIPSDAGTRLLALRELEPGAISVASVDLLERRSVALGELRATRWADGYDGSGWFLADDAELWLLDVLVEGPSALWRLGPLGGPVVAVVREPGQLVVYRLSLEALVVQRFTLPELRELAPSQLGSVPDHHVLLPGGDRYRVTQEGTTVVVHRRGVEAPLVVVQLTAATRVALHLDHGCLVVADDLGRVEVVDLEAGERRLSYRARA